MTIGCCEATPEGNREVTDLRLLRNDRAPSPCNQNVTWQYRHFQALRAAAPNPFPPNDCSLYLGCTSKWPPSHGLSPVGLPPLKMIRALFLWSVQPVSLQNSPYLFSHR